MTYVGGEACAECHAQEVRRWQGSHHDLAMQPATPQTVLGDFDNAVFTYGDVVTTFYRQGMRFYVRTDGPDGELAEFPVSYTFGVTPLQQYLIEFADGRMQALSIAWDSRPAAKGGQRWYHLYPGERISHGDPLHWTGSYQNWNHMCAECHSTNLRKNFRPAEDRFETTWSDIDVSCEACHGPGSKHVELARSMEDGDKYSAEFTASLSVRLTATDLGTWTIDPETGTARREAPPRQPLIDVCAPCHSRRTSLSQHVIPGRPFLDTHSPALLEEGLYHPDGQILDEVYVYGSFIQSKMYAAGVTCANCHDSHGLGLLAEGNALCAQCHLASKFDSPTHHFHRLGSEGAQCVGCHMPDRTYMGVDARRDHSMRIPRPDLTVKTATPNACGACHSDRSAEWADAYMTEWYGLRESDHFGDVIAAARLGDPRSFEEVVSMVADSTLPGIVRATAVTLAGSYHRRAGGQAVERASGDRDPLVRLASARTLASQGIPGRQRMLTTLLFDSIRAVRTEAVQAIATAQSALVQPQHLKAYERALTEYHATLRTHADRPESWVSLALIDAAAGRYAEAESSLRSAIRMDSQFTVAYVNLADLLRAQARDEAGELRLREGLHVNPESAALHHALGLLLVRMDRRDEAAEELRRAAELAPESPRFVYAHAIAVHSTGRLQEALEVLTGAVLQHPNDSGILSALVSFHLEAGHGEPALEYARRLAVVEPEDAGVAELVRALGSPQPQSKDSP